MQSGRLKEFFDPVTEAIEKTEKQVGQLVPIPNIAGLPAPLAGPVGPPAIEGPGEPEREEEVEGADGLRAVEMDPTGMHLDIYDAEKQFGDLDEMSDEHKINEAKQMNRELGKLEKKPNDPAVYATLLQKIRGISRNCREKLGKD